MLPCEKTRTTEAEVAGMPANIFTVSEVFDSVAQDFFYSKIQSPDHCLLAAVQ